MKPTIIISFCRACGGAVAFKGRHQHSNLDSDRWAEFYQEVIEYDLKIKEEPFNVYQKTEHPFCECDNK